MADLLVPIAISSEIDDTGVERVHAAKFTPTVRPAWVAPSSAIYLGLNNELNLKKSIDGGLNFTETPNTGVVASSTNSVVATAGRMYHWSFVDDPNNTFTTIDGTNFTRTTGISGFTASMSELIKTSTEWQLYVNNGIDYLYVSTNGVDFVLRTFATGPVRRPVQFGTKILGIGTATGNTLVVSTDEGLTYSSYTIGDFNSTTGIQSLAVTPSGNYIAFGRNGSGNFAIGTSATGLSGSWTVVPGPTLSTYALCSAVTPAGRILVVLADGATYYSDNEGSTWTAGALVTYASPPTAIAVVSNPVNVLLYAQDAEAFLVATAQGSGVFEVYRSVDGVAPWVLVYTAPSARTVNGIAEL